MILQSTARRAIGKGAIAGIIIVLIVIAGAGIYFAALPGKSPSSSSSSSTTSTTGPSSTTSSGPVTLQVYMVAEPGSSALQNIVQDFTSQTGINVQFNILPYGTLQVKQASVLGAHSSAADVVLVDDVWRGQYVGNGWVIPLDNYIAQNAAAINMTDFIPGLVINNMMYGGHYYGMGFISADHVIYYRTDIFNKYGLTMANISTWQGLVNTEQFLQTKLAGTGMYPIDIMGARGVQVVCTYFNLIGSYNVLYTGTDANSIYNSSYYPQVNSQAALAASSTLANITKYGIPSIPSDDYGEVQSNFATGKVAMALGWQNMAPAFSDPSTSKIIGDYAAAQTPGVQLSNGTIARTPTLGGWGMDISAFSQHKDAAWKFVQWATSASTELYASKYEDMDRYSSWNAPSLVSLHAPYKAAAVADLEIAFARPYIAAWPAMSDMMGVILNEIVSGTTTVPQGMNTLQAEYLSYLSDTGTCTIC